MKKLAKLLCAALTAALLLTALGGIPGAQAFLWEKSCDTQYPIVLAHGAGFRDDGLFDYWGRIPIALRLRGAKVFYGNQDAFGSIESNAEMLKQQINCVLARTGAEKVNIIAHSKGGIESRYMISSLGMASKVASLTTISTPHHGSNTVQVYMHVPEQLRRLIAIPVDLNFKLQGDSNPDFYNGSEALTSSYMVQFNKDNPDAPGVYYQSWAARMPTVFGDLLLSPFFAVVSWFDGPNDGLVSVESAQWGNYRGIIPSAGRGVSHADATDYRKMRFTLFGNDDGYTDITEFYTDMVSELKEMGF